MPCTNILQQFLPHPAVSAYVSSVVVIENCNPQLDVVLPLIANGYPGIAFQITDSGLRSDTGGKTDTLFVYGQFIKPVELYTTGRLTFIAFFFHPHVLKSITGTDGKELADRCIDLHFFQPAKKTHLEDQLFQASSLSMRISILNNFVLQLAARNHLAVNKNIIYSTQAIRNSMGLIPLKHIQAQLNMTERTFERLFAFHVGVSPKMFSRICQFHSAFQQISQRRYAKLSDIAYGTGYADQSHLSRVFKEFTHHTPNEYQKRAAAFQAKLQ